jgi:ferredoxin
MLLRKERVADLLGELAKQARVYVPTKEEGVSAIRGAAAPAAATPVPAAPAPAIHEAMAPAPTANATAACFALYQPTKEPAFQAVNTMMPPKDILFPQTQKMYRYGFDAEGNAFIDTIHDADEVVLFGLRSCDVASIECMDDVFLTKGYDDEFYGARRALLTTIAIGCAETAETCFCDSMGLDPNTAPQADIQLNASTSGDVYLVTAQTERGETALEAWLPFLEDGADDVRIAQGVCTLKVNATGIKEKLDGLFEHPLWDEVAKKCLTCGTCTFVCPTCHCFDISQENRMREGERFRCWDSCMFTAYTEMAGHHNPRVDKTSRVRQRFMHKLCFFEERYGKSLCVGCGRCVEMCPVALDITCLIDKIGAVAIDSNSGNDSVDDIDAAHNVSAAKGVVNAVG